MTPEERKAALVLRRVKLVTIARELDVTPTLVSQVVRGKSISARVMERVAVAIHKPVEEVFPQQVA